MVSYCYNLGGVGSQQDSTFDLYTMMVKTDTLVLKHSWFLDLPGKYYNLIRYVSVTYLSAIKS